MSRFITSGSEHMTESIERCLLETRFQYTRPKKETPHIKHTLYMYIVYGGLSPIYRKRFVTALILGLCVPGVVLAIIVT